MHGAQARRWRDGRNNLAEERGSGGGARWAALAADGSTANQTAVDEAWAAGSAPRARGGPAGRPAAGARATNPISKIRGVLEIRSDF